ncbi:MAG: hypothetical protein M1828_002199 [Chrysothrix sp. TS-e1954]|nr:MAG: hypothetical protein M1828_002199 [Chrysothrix sp. TS-e1954]
MVQSHAHAIKVSAIVWPFITAVFIGLRIYAKGFITRRFALNDYVAIATVPVIIAFSVCITEASYNGAGNHQWDFTKQLNERYYFWVLVSSEFYALGLMGYKVALLLLYLSIFNIYPKFRWACYITMFYVIGYLTCNIITEVAGCQPVEKFWKEDVPGHCINSKAADIAYGVGHVTSDLIIAILPLPMVWRLQMKQTRDKVGLALVLSSGAVAFGVAVARYAVSVTDLMSKDRSYIAGLNWILAIAEMNTGLICSCTPALKPLFRMAKESSQNWSRKLSEGITTDKSGHSRSTSRGGFFELKNLSSSRKSRDDHRSPSPFHHPHNGVTKPAPTLTTNATDTDNSDTWAKYAQDDLWGEAAGKTKDEGTYNHVEFNQPPRPRSASRPISPFRMTSDELFEGTQLAPKENRTGLTDLERVNPEQASDAKVRTGRSR